MHLGLYPASVLPSCGVRRLASDQTTLGLSFFNININCPYLIGLLGVGGVLHELV